MAFVRQVAVCFITGRWDCTTKARAYYDKVLLIYKGHMLISEAICELILKNPWLTPRYVKLAVICPYRQLSSSTQNRGETQMVKVVLQLRCRSD